MKNRKENIIKETVKAWIDEWPLMTKTEKVADIQFWRDGLQDCHGFDENETEEIIDETLRRLAA
jgi:hypothetical protein